MLLSTSGWAKWSPALDFKIRDKVYLNAKFLHTTHPSWKLSNKNVGPYEIITKPSSHSFTLRLPDSMHAVHPVFHVLQLEPASSSSIPGWVPTPPPPVLIEGKPEFEISEILNSKVDRCCCLCKLLYLVWIQRHWWRNLLDSCLRTREHLQACRRIPLSLST